MNKKNYFIISLEWPSWSWKSTISKLVVDRLRNILFWEECSVYHLWEAGDYWNYKKLIKKPFLKEELYFNHKILLESEIKRTKKINKIIKETWFKIIIMERNYLTYLYTEAAFWRLWMKADYKFLRKSIEKSISDWDIVIPDYTFFIKVNSKKAAERIKIRNTYTDEKFSKEKNLILFQEYIDMMVWKSYIIHNMNFEFVENEWEINNVVNYIVYMILYDILKVFNIY